MSYIYILPIDIEPQYWIDTLAPRIQRTFGFPAQRFKRKITLDAAFDINRSQYNASRILRDIIDRPPKDTVKILGLINVDLFIPILTFVFGEAQLKGMGSLVSFHRLNSKFYGLSEDKALLTERLVKEAVHELGHNFGLIHCPNQRCVMRSSTYVEDIDCKSVEMCDRCRTRLDALKSQN